jgi:hypothetical protein
MKCDHLIGRTFDGDVYILASDVMEAIAELKAKLDRAIAERDGNQVCIDALKQKLESVQASMYCDVVDANMENRRLKRALWLARAMRAEAQWNRQLRDAGIAFAIGENKSWDSWNQKQKKWQVVERKCRAKAEEYK